MDERIISFLKENTVFTLATSCDNIPYCVNCFYAFDRENELLIFKSKKETLHIKQALDNALVSGTIVPDNLDPVNIRGIQFSGSFLVPKHKLLESLNKTYHKKFPFAFAFSGEIWAVELLKVRMTDRVLGMGKRLEWEKKQSTHYEPDIQPSVGGAV